MRRIFAAIAPIIVLVLTSTSASAGPGNAPSGGSSGCTASVSGFTCGTGGAQPPAIQSGAGVGKSSSTPNVSPPPLCAVGQNGPVTVPQSANETAVITPNYVLAPISPGGGGGTALIPPAPGIPPFANPNLATVVGAELTAGWYQTAATHQIYFVESWVDTYTCTYKCVTVGTQQQCSEQTSAPVHGNATMGPPVMGASLPPAAPTPGAGGVNLPALAQSVTAGWQRGRAVESPAGATYVGIPSCAWIDGAGPEPSGDYSSEKVIRNYPANPGLGGTLTMDTWYTLTVTPGPISWNFGDGVSNGKSSEGAVDSPPNGLPQYDPQTQSWPTSRNSCDVSGAAYHTYTSVDPVGRHITASISYTISAAFHYNIGAGDVSQPIACAAGGGPCIETLNWDGGVHPVYQIEAVPTVK